MKKITYWITLGAFLVIVFVLSAWLTKVILYADIPLWLKIWLLK